MDFRKSLKLKRDPTFKPSGKMYEGLWKKLMQETKLDSLGTALESALRGIFRADWDVVDENQKRSALMSIRYTVIRVQEGKQNPDQVVEHLERWFAGRKEKGLPASDAILLLSQSTISKAKLCELFGVNPKQPRTIERWSSDGVKGARLIRRGKNGRYLTADVMKFMNESGKRSDLLLPFLKDELTKRRK